MAVAAFGTKDAPMHLDVCRACHMVWFDTREEDQLPLRPAAVAGSTEPPLSAPAQAALQQWKREEALAQVRAMSAAHAGGAPPKNGLQKLLGYVGFPIEEGAPSIVQIPFVTWQLAVLCILCGFLSQGQGLLQESMGFHPSDPFRHGGVSALTSFLVHGGWLHLIGNVYFLLIFGDNVEELLGWWRYLALLVVATVAGSFCHALVTTRPERVLIGASGGISSLLVFYALAFPQARLRWFVWRARPIRSSSFEPWVAIPVRFWLAGWTVIQAVGLLNRLEGRTRVSAAAHLGGAFVGLLAWLWLGRGRKPR